MSAFCPREREVLELVGISQWPQRADADLRTHVEGCACCSDLVTVATAFFDASESAVVVPDATVVWQRAQWKARQEEARRAARPVVAAQLVTGAGLLAGLLVAVFWLAGAFVPWWSDRASSPTSLLSSTSASVAGAVASVRAFGMELLAREIPPGLMWIFFGVLATSLLTVGIALGLSTLADRTPNSPTHR